MSSEWSLPNLLANLHDAIEGDLRRAREALAHPTEKGDASEAVWIEVLNKYLPRRYEARKAHVVDSEGVFSEQIDVVIHDRQYSPLVFTFQDSFIVPAESVYAVFEAKQEMTADHIAYAQRKVASVRRLHRTSVPVPTVEGVKPPKEPQHILGGMLTLACGWSPAFGDTMAGHLTKDLDTGRLDIGCVADSGFFNFDLEQQAFHFDTAPRPATRFLFELIARLQEMATVPMLDVRAYANQIPR
ncbi:hypothetical protein FQY83_11345 [Luteimonas marina]|uniref:DUF6602 domain-containing protein n=1 Tax=Luteimonas marina TaxID=488485 RepID=A0A5C5U304_9GAMM|nr:DUF6602 domain-containing protein [Luteimonas marina]TWT20317.1 hypothetical protein FQY83_11345 [Luteimonas marina]